jgi:hypothetical protein
MALPVFPIVESLSLSDERLGARMLAWYIGAIADKLGIDPNTPGFADAVKLNVPTVEAKHAEGAALEKALRLAAGGELTKAGTLFREIMHGGAYQVRLNQLAEVGFRRVNQSAEWGRKGSKANKIKGDQNRDIVLAAAKAIIAERTRKPTGRELAKLVEMRSGINANTVRAHLRKLRRDKILD